MMNNAGATVRSTTNAWLKEAGANNQRTWRAEEDPKAGELLPIRCDFEYEYDSEAYRLHISKLASPRSINVAGNNCYCDCHDLARVPRVYRILPFSQNSVKSTSWDYGCINDDLPILNRLAAITNMQKNILFFNSRMVDVSGPFNPETMHSILLQGHIPVGNVALFQSEPRKPGDLGHYFKRLGFEQSSDSPFIFTVGWGHLVDLARQNLLVSEYVKNEATREV